MTADAAPFSGGRIDDWLRIIAARHPFAIDMELSRAEKVRAALNLRLQMPVATVGGTNGKGSVCALAGTMMQAAGARVGLYTSPHLIHFRERICIDGVPVADEVLLDAFEKVEHARARCGESLTYFEFTTLAAAYIFSAAEVDAVVLEVGLGGRLDAVNLFSPAAAAVTNVGLDHQEFLGNDRETIAIEKAGIFRRGCPAVVGETNPPASLLAAAEKIGAGLCLAGRDFFAEPSATGWRYRGKRDLFGLPFPALRGRHQLGNAAMAIALLEQMPAHLWPGAGGVRHGLHAAAVPGRAQVLPGIPATVLDVAHNTEAAAALERMLFDMGWFPKTAAVLGMLARKDAAGFVRVLHRRVDEWFVARPEEGDKEAAETAQAVAEAGGRAKVFDSIADAVRAAREYCGNDGRIVITGSFMTVADYIRSCGK